VTIHPATLLFAWGVLVALLQPLSALPLAWIATAVLPLALIFARRRTLALLRRTRWLFLSIAVLFALATPGQRLPGFAGDLGITHDGLLLATEHALRLLLLLTSLAVVHERLGTPGMMAGLYWLLAPLTRWRSLRERVVVRLMLVLDHVENTPAATWRDWLNKDLVGPDRLGLSVGSLHLVDWVALVSLGLLAYLQSGPRG
jgi:energy-coupling factor transport system permease protein